MVSVLAPGGLEPYREIAVQAAQDATAELQQLLELMVKHLVPADLRNQANTLMALRPFESMDERVVRDSIAKPGARLLLQVGICR